MEALRSVEDPELGMDVVELGLVYDAEIHGPKVKVIYSLTSMGCPAGPLIQQNIEEAVRALPEVEDVETELTWDPRGRRTRCPTTRSSSPRRFG